MVLYSIDQLHEIVNQEIPNSKLKKEPNELYAPIEYILSIGGKRIRPLLVLMGYNLFSENIEEALNAAIAIEIFHNFTLAHDDIMDNSSMRRNMPTIHKKWNNNVAILSGDAMLIKAYQYISKYKNNILSKILDVFNKTAIEVCEGQQFDMNFEQRIDVSENEYLNMIKLKTSVLIAASLKIGAIIANAKEDDTNSLYNFGLNLGLAFQLQDDMLDVYGKSEIFGKKIGGDIIANKKTYLLIKALEITKSDNKSKLIEILKQKEFDNNKKIKTVIEIYNSVGIKEQVENKISEYYSKAKDSLSDVNINESRKSELIALSNKLMKRNM